MGERKQGSLFFSRPVINDMLAFNCVIDFEGTCPSFVNDPKCVNDQGMGI